MATQKHYLWAIYEGLRFVCGGEEASRREAVAAAQWAGLNEDLKRCGTYSVWNPNSKRIVHHEKLG